MFDSFVGWIEHLEELGFNLLTQSSGGQTLLISPLLGVGSLNVSISLLNRAEVRQQHS